MDPGCSYCGVDVYGVGEFAYMLHNAVWKEAVERGYQMNHNVGQYSLLCVGCLETCLGRKLRESDFNSDVPLNKPDMTRVYGRSPRLLDRMNNQFVREKWEFFEVSLVRNPEPGCEMRV